jgi:hypothetical protein
LRGAGRDLVKLFVGQLAEERDVAQEVLDADGRCRHAAIVRRAGAGLL